MGARFLSNPHFHMEIVKIDGYYKAFCQNRWVQLDISQNRWVQLHPLTRSKEGPVKCMWIRITLSIFSKNVLTQTRSIRISLSKIPFLNTERICGFSIILLVPTNRYKYKIM